jgi:hypothetical protein
MAIDIFAQLGFTLIGAFIGFLFGHAIGWLLGSVIDDATYSSDGIKSTPTKSIRNAKTTIHKPTKSVRYEEPETEEISEVKPIEPAISFDNYLIFISEEVTEELKLPLAKITENYSLSKIEAEKIIEELILLGKINAYYNPFTTELMFKGTE